MSHGLPPKPPSALDGYRRLARTRAAAGNDAAEAAAVGVPEDGPRGRRTRSSRVVGALRLTAFVAVLMMIVGTSVGLASSDAPDPKPASRSAAVAAPVVTVERTVAPAVQQRAAKPKPAAKHTTTRAAKPAPMAKASTADSTTVPIATTTATESTTAAPSRALPFTGEQDVQRMILFGAVLVFLGMLTQIAGQPLPAERGHAARRR